MPDRPVLVTADQTVGELYVPGPGYAGTLRAVHVQIPYIRPDISGMPGFGNWLTCASMSLLL